MLCGRFHVGHTVPYQLNYISKDFQTHRRVYMEQFGTVWNMFQDLKKICGRFRVFQIVSYQLNYISKDPPIHGRGYLRV